MYVSTDYVFSGDRAEPYPEDYPTDPISCYGATKLEGERAAAALDRHLIVRTSWVFGEGRNFVRAVLQGAAAGSGEDLPVVDSKLPCRSPADSRSSWPAGKQMRSR